ncbi:MAG TPA: hypothetical protein VL334_00910 [Anaerolineae bacterium]|nr:hypothetical protein [Anaerolineae bacterium]
MSVVQDTVWLGGAAPSYDDAQAILQCIGRLHISCASVWRRVQVWGEQQFKALAEVERVQATALPPPQWEPPNRAAVRDRHAGTEILLPVRSAILSKRFDELWAKVYRAPQA